MLKTWPALWGYSIVFICAGIRGVEDLWPIWNKTSGFWLQIPNKPLKRQVCIAIWPIGPISCCTLNFGPARLFSNQIGVTFRKGDFWLVSNLKMKTHEKTLYYTVSHFVFTHPSGEWGSSRHDKLELPTKCSSDLNQAVSHKSHQTWQHDVIMAQRMTWHIVLTSNALTETVLAVFSQTLRSNQDNDLSSWRDAKWRRGLMQSVTCTWNCKDQKSSVSSHRAFSLSLIPGSL